MIHPRVSTLQVVAERSPAEIQADAELRNLLGPAPIPIALMDLELRALLFSAGWIGGGVTPPDLDPGAVARYFADDVLTETARLALATSQLQTCRVQTPILADGKQRWFMLDVNGWPQDGSPFRYLVASGREVTEVVLAAREAEAARQALADQNARFDAALHNMPHGLCMFDADKRLILCNAAYGRLYGLPSELMAPGTPLDRILEHRAATGSAPANPSSYFSVTVDAALQGSAASSDIPLTDGRTIRITHNPMANGGYVATHEDISAINKAASQIEFLAFRDTLTGLPNRAAFQRAFDEAVLSAEHDGEAFGLIMVDVDFFKDVNDTLGHDAGDALLQALAGHLQRAFRHGDTVARLGGDEFAIILRGLRGAADMTRPIAVLQDYLRTPIQHAGQSFTISASIGAALHDDPEADPTHLLKNADVALYQAKHDGRNRAVVFAPAMRTQVERRVELLRDIRAAVALGEFDLHYQPVIDLASNSVVSFEALMRWNHPEQGVLTPAAFWVAFEDNDLSLQLGEVAFERALKQMREWLDDGVEFGRVAVNVSSAQFRSGRLALEIEGKLAKWRVPADRLTIEVTENVYMSWGSDVVGETVRRLHDAGVMIALDDFGTGYASLANLRQFPIDRLKIDKSFVQSDDDDAIVRAVINLGSSLGMKVVAEGVEKSEQVDTLARYGCDQVQGYHFARPMPAAEVGPFLKAFARS